MNNPQPFRPVQERVMSTTSWPVPYYKRMFKSSAVHTPRNLSLDVRSSEITDLDVIKLKNKLELNPAKRDIVRGFEDNVKTNSKILTKRNDCHL